jgi:mono/diheme cytochrome c family protein
MELVKTIGRGRTMSKIFVGLFSLTLLAALTNTALAADAGNGERLASRWCAACHIVAADQTKGSTQAPPFSAIAKQPGFNDARLALYLLLPHPRMPDMSLSRSEAADLAAYIAIQGR